jgi:hypothetical protein
VARERSFGPSQPGHFRKPPTLLLGGREVAKKKAAKKAVKKKGTKKKGAKKKKK